MRVLKYMALTLIGLFFILVAIDTDGRSSDDLNPLRILLWAFGVLFIFLVAAVASWRTK